MGSSSSVPADSPLGKVLKRWARVSCPPMTKKRMVLYCSSTWPSYALGPAGRWPVHGSWDPDAILQLERFCREAGRADELPYVLAFRALLEREREKSKPKAQRREGRPQPATPGSPPAASRAVSLLGCPSGQNPSHHPSPREDPRLVTPDPKTALIPSVWEVKPPHQNTVCPPSPQEHPRVTAEPQTVLIPSVFEVKPPHQNSVCPPSPQEHPRVTAEPQPVLIPSVWEVRSPHQNNMFPPSPQELYPIMTSEPKSALMPSLWEVGPLHQRNLYPPLPTNLDLQYEAGPVASSVSPYCQTLQSSQFGLGVSACRARQFPLWQHPEGNHQGPPVEYMAHDLELLKNHRPSYKADPQGMMELFASIFATHHPTWSYVQTLMDSLLTAGEKILVLHKARQEAGRLHQENPAGYMEANMAVPYGQPLWDPNDGDLPEIEHYRRCILVGLEKATPYYDRGPHV